MAQGGGLVGDASSPNPGELTPALTAGAVWHEPLAPVNATGAYEDDLGVAEAVSLTRRMPLQAVISDGDTLITRTRGTIWAFDALTLRTRWRVPELVRGEPTAEQSDLAAALSAMVLGSTGGQEELSTDANLLLSDALRHVLSTGAGLVFTIESAAFPPDQTDELGSMHLVGIDFALPSNELVARDLASGDVVWRRGHDADDPLFAASFQDAPIMVRGRLCTAGKSRRVAAAAARSSQRGDHR